MTYFSISSYIKIWVLIKIQNTVINKNGENAFIRQLFYNPTVFPGGEDCSSQDSTGNMSLRWQF